MFDYSNSTGANKALGINPPNAAIDITTHGSDWLWAAFSLFMLSDLGMATWMWLRPKTQRVLHLLPIVILTATSVAYFTMASDLGSTPIVAEFYGPHHQDMAGEPATRAIWYARYIGWTLSLPLLVLELLLGTGMSATELSSALFMEVVFVVSYLVGALVSTTYKWGYFTMGTAALLYVVSYIVGPAAAAAGTIGSDVRKVYIRTAPFFAFVLLLYPIAWGLSEGGNVIHPDGEMVFYGILDLVIQPIFLCAYLFQLRDIDISRFGFAPRQVIVSEKVAATA
ncbi:family A G protein-coupled receptor-like protein [Calocera viscosa TUFC12733]|uniref:Family A G protein-coupled receptor-like protein n=1 Tax=Calocera viscosa (strain TUFC12733) TaxID=1330018 RepID=A0A167NCB1_CALVF|nr:family A G protein-coupled receptor-like protein [Calocera viscosa TUFC12733]